MCRFVIFAKLIKFLFTQQLSHFFKGVWRYYGFWVQWWDQLKQICFDQWKVKEPKHTLQWTKCKSDTSYVTWVGVPWMLPVTHSCTLYIQYVVWCIPDRLQMWSKLLDLSASQLHSHLCSELSTSVWITQDGCQCQVWMGSLCSSPVKSHFAF